MTKCATENCEVPAKRPPLKGEIFFYET